MPTPLFNPGTPKPVDSGRKKGTPNKITLTVKEQIELCYQRIGGDKRFSEWANENPDLFYVHIYPKIIPKDIHVTGTIGVAQLLIEAGSIHHSLQRQRLSVCLWLWWMMHRMRLTCSLPSPSLPRLALS